MRSKLILPSKKKKGVILITILLILTIVIMIVTLIMNSATASMKLAGSYGSGEQAYYAAVSGLEYVRERLYNNAKWMQTLSGENIQGPLVFYDDNGKRILEVSEDHKTGLVKGEFYKPDEKIPVSTFELAFADLGEASSNSVYGKDFPNGLNYLSCNNFITGAEARTYRLKNGKMTEFNKVGEGMVSLIVKGSSGNVKKYVTANLQIDQIRGISSSTAARGSINVMIVRKEGVFDISSDDETTPSMIRAQGLKNGQLDPVNGSIWVSSTHWRKHIFKLANNGIAYAPKVKINSQILDPNAQPGSLSDPAQYDISIDTVSNEETAHLLNSAEDLDWSSVASDAEESVKSGAYIYSVAGKEWRLYPNIELLPDAKGVKILDTVYSPVDTLYPESMPQPTLNVKGNKISSGSVFIGAVNDDQDIKKDTVIYTKILSKPGENAICVSDKLRTTLKIADFASSLQIGNSLSDPQSSPSIIVCGNLEGQGKIFSKGDVCFQGGSYFETEQNSGVAVYADRNVKILPATVSSTSQLEDYLLKAWRIVYEQGTTYKNVDKVVTLLLKTKVDGKTISEHLSCAGIGRKDKRLFLSSFVSNNSEALADTLSSVELNALCCVIEPLALNPFTTFPASTYNPYSEGLTGIENTDSSGKTKVAVSIVNGFNMWTSNTSGAGQSLNNVMEFINDGKEYYRIFVHYQTADYISDYTAGSQSDLFIYIPKEGSGGSESLHCYYFFCDGRKQDGTYKRYAAKTEKHNGYSNLKLAFAILGLNINGEQILIDKNFFNKVIEKNQWFVAEDQGDGQYNTTSFSDLDEQGTISANLKTTVKNFLPVENYNKLVVTISQDFTSYTAISSEGYSGDNGSSIVLNKDPEFLKYNDTKVNGMFFMRNGDFMANIGKGSLAVRGGIIAYKGNINMSAGYINLCYDPNYMRFFLDNAKGVTSSYTFCAVFDDYNK